MNLVDKIKIMTAAVAGMIIQVQPKPEGGVWYDVDNPTWNWDSFTYRVKPKEPCKVWGRVPLGGTSVVQTSTFEATIDEAIHKYGGTKITFIEEMK